ENFPFFISVRRQQTIRLALTKRANGAFNQRGTVGRRASLDQEGARRERAVTRQGETQHHMQFFRVSNASRRIPTFFYLQLECGHLLRQEVRPALRWTIEADGLSFSEIRRGRILHRLSDPRRNDEFSDLWCIRRPLGFALKPSALWRVGRR